MPDSSTKTISRLSRRAFFKGRPGPTLPVAHGILVALDGPLLGLLRAKTQRAQDAPNLRLAKANAVHAFDDCAHTLERPQFSAKSVFSGTLQEGRTNSCQLLLIELGRAPSLGHLSQGIDSAFIEQSLPRVHRLPSHAHSQRHLGAALARQQQPTRLQSFLCCFA